jgi:hypothetical protein
MVGFEAALRRGSLRKLDSPVSPDPCLCPSLTQSNRHGTGPVGPVWEGWHCEVSPYPEQDQFCDIDGVS